MICFFHDIIYGVNKAKNSKDVYKRQAITDYSEYLKLMNNYNAPKLTWFDFKYVYAIIVVRASADNTIDIKDIENEDAKSYLNISIGLSLIHI